MKLTLIFSLVFLSASTAFSQILPGRKVPGPITILDTIKVSVGDTIKLGEGSGANKGFIFFFDGQRHSARPDMSNTRLIIKGLKIIDDNSYRKYYALVLPGGIFNWAIDLESAIRSGEVRGLNKTVFRDNRWAVIMQTKVSVADELTKLKKLLDQGVISKDEFDAQKKKLLKE